MNNLYNKSQNINRQIIKGDYRNKELIVGSHGIIQERAIPCDENVASIIICNKNNKFYIGIENLDCRRRRLEIQGDKDFSKIYRICFIS